jgi:hypothetical protein
MHSMLGVLVCMHVPDLCHMRSAHFDGTRVRMRSAHIVDIRVHMRSAHFDEYVSMHPPVSLCFLCIYCIHVFRYTG